MAYRSLRIGIATAIGCLLLGQAAAMAPEEYRADIITPLVTLALSSLAIPSSIGFTVAGVSLSINIAAGIASLAYAAIGIGLSLLTAPKQKNPSEVGLVPIQQPLPFRNFGYGRIRFAGPWVFKEALNGVLLQVLAVCGHKIAEFVTVYMNDDAVTPISYSYDSYLDGAYSGTVNSLADGRYANGVITFDTRLGEDTETYHRLIALYAPDHWNYTARGDKVASLAVAAIQASSKDQGKFFPYGQPIPSAVFDAAEVFNPGVSGQDKNNPATFEHSDNLALCIMHYLCFSPYGPQKDYDRAIAPVVDDWLNEVAICDEAMPLKAGGTEPRYRCAGMGSAEQEQDIALRAMLACGDAWLCERGDGSIILRVGKYRGPPELVLTDDDILDFRISDNLRGDRRINIATARYTSPDNGYTSVDTDPIIDSTDQARRQGPPRVAQLDLTWVQHTGQASRLLRYEMNKQALKIRGTLYLRLSAINILYERWALIRSNTIPFLSNAEIEISKPRVNILAGMITVDFKLSGEEVYAYDAATDESTPPSVPERPDQVSPEAPANVGAVASQSTQAEGYTITLDVYWDAETLSGVIRQDFLYDIQWRIKPASGETTNWVLSRAEPVLSGSVWYASAGVVPADTTLEVQVRTVWTNGYTSPWSDPANEVSTASDSVAPDQPTNFSGTPVTGGADLEAQAPNSANFDALQFYRAATGDPFNTSSPVGSPVYGAQNAILSYTDSVAAGTYDYFVVALNAQEVASTPAGPVTVVVV